VSRRPTAPPKRPAGGACSRPSTKQELDDLATRWAAYALWADPDETPSATATAPGSSSAKAVGAASIYHEGDDLRDLQERGERLRSVVVNAVEAALQGGTEKEKRDTQIAADAWVLNYARTTGCCVKHKDVLLFRQCRDDTGATWRQFDQAIKNLPGKYRNAKRGRPKKK
jgi:hypothetical protein